MEIPDKQSSREAAADQNTLRLVPLPCSSAG
jgi:hypothetical protein